MYLVALVSCNKNDTFQDNSRSLTTHAVTTQNLLDRFSNLSLEEQRIEFINLSPKQRHRVWIQKFDTLINSTTDKNEKRFYSNLKNKLTTSLFSESIGHDDFNKNWAPILESLQREYKWTNDDIFVMFATLYKVTKAGKGVGKTTLEVGELEYHLQRPGIPEFEINCNCRWEGLGCADGSCNKNSKCPNDLDDDIGCGLFFMQSCTGECSIA